MATFRLTNINGQTRSFTLRTILNLLGDTVNRNIDIGDETFNLDSFVELVGVAPVLTTPAAPTIGTVDDGGDKFGFAASPGVAISGHEYRINGGAWTVASTNPISVGDISILAGAMEVRVAGVVGYSNPSAVLTNATAFTAFALVANNVEWVSVNADPYAGLAIADAFVYTGSAAIPSTVGPEVLDVHAHPANQWLITRRPVANSVKTFWDESGTANMNVGIPGLQFQPSFVARGYLYIVSNDVVFNPNPAARLTLHT